MNHAALFDAVRTVKGAPLTQADVDLVNAALGISATSGARKTNALGRNLIKEFEGLRLKAYPDPATGGDPWTVGYGHTGPEVKPGLLITMDKAEEYLSQDLARFERAVSRLALKATDNQFAALVSLAYNVGENNLAKSTLLRRHNAGDYVAARSEFARWNRAAGKVMAGLTRRRAAEAALYAKL